MDTAAAQIVTFATLVRALVVTVNVVDVFAASDDSVQVTTL